MPDDFGLDPDQIRQLLQAPQSAPPSWIAAARGMESRMPSLPPQAISGALPGVVDPNVGGQGQGAPAGIPGVPRPRISVEKAGSWPKVPTQSTPNAGFPTNAIPGPGDLLPNRAQPQAANIPPPQAAPGQPQMPAIPPASPVGRTQAAQGQGNPLDQYFKQMMALQQRQQLMAMAGGLLGAPSFGQGLGRAFTNAAQTMGPQQDLVSRIAGAQMAYQNALQNGGSQREAQTAAEASLAGAAGEYWKSRLNPEIKGLKYLNQDVNFVNRGGALVDPKTGYRSWVFGHMGKDGQGNNVPINQAQPFTDKDGRRVIILDDGRKVDPTAEEPE